MSFVVDQVRRIDGQLDRLQLEDARQTSISASSAAAASADNLTYLGSLRGMIKTLSSTAATPNSPLVPRRRVVAILRRLLHTTAREDGASHTHEGGNFEGQQQSTEETPIKELEWLLIGKAAAQAYGHVLSAILDHTIPLSDDMWYWEGVASSYRRAGLYSVQTGPERIWHWSWDIYARTTRAVERSGLGGLWNGSWGQFYGLVRMAVYERSIADVQRQVVSPLAVMRAEARQKQAALRQMKALNANALGVLLGEGLSNESMNEDGGLVAAAMDGTNSLREGDAGWKISVAKSVALMEAVMRTLSRRDLSEQKFDESIAAMTQDDPFYDRQATVDGEASALKLRTVATRIEGLLAGDLPAYTTSFNALVKIYGKPSRLVRYWLPLSLGALFSGTLTRIAFSHKTEIITWIREFGTTVIDFWTNWVVEPARRVVGTIRHDEDSEVSILSKRSLEGDRESLERMVVDFAVDNPGAVKLTDAEVADIRVKVREGDLTPVLRAYEKDMQKPFIGTVRGNLIRAVLIQVQKTKVDVEVAMAGIDSILKSQELLFGFIGLTPGVLVTVAVYRWLFGTFRARKGLAKGSHGIQLVRELRNINRILVAATPTEFGELSYKDHGLLLCELHLLRQRAAAVLPERIFRDFLEDVDELVDVRIGVVRQVQVMERMRWAYARWLQ